MCVNRYVTLGSLLILLSLLPVSGALSESDEEYFNRPDIFFEIGSCISPLITKIHPKELKCNFEYQHIYCSTHSDIFNRKFAIRNENAAASLHRCMGELQGQYYIHKNRKRNKFRSSRKVREEDIDYEWTIKGGGA